MTERKDLVIGIDSGTSSCKAIVWDGNGRPVSSGVNALSVVRSQTTWHEQPAESWWQALIQALRLALSGIDPSRLAALCITHQRETFVPVDADGRPLRQGILWMDERAGSLLPSLADRLDSDRYHELTGKPLSGNLTYPKIAWLRRHEPGLFNHVHKFLDVHAYLVYRLTGHYITSWGSADPTGLLDIHRKRWAPELLEIIGITQRQLPQPYPPGESIGRVKASAAREAHLPLGLPVVAGLGDGQASALGAGVTAFGDACLSLGTSVIAGTCLDKPVTSPHFRTMIAGVPENYLLEQVILGGTYTIDWLAQDLLGLTQGTEIDDRSVEQILTEEAAQLPPGADGLMLVPYWNSAMNPYWDATASGMTIGWRGIHQRSHLYRAILEGIAFELRLQAEGVTSSLGKQLSRYVAVGGGSQNDLWCQVISDVTGRPVIRAEVAETAALGAGILAAVSAGIHPNVKRAARAMVKVRDKQFVPDQERHDFYSRLYEQVYRHIYPSLRASLARLAELAV